MLRALQAVYQVSTGELTTLTTALWISKLIALPLGKGPLKERGIDKMLHEAREDNRENDTAYMGRKKMSEVHGLLFRQIRTNRAMAGWFRRPILEVALGHLCNPTSSYPHYLTKHLALGSGSLLWILLLIYSYC